MDELTFELESELAIVNSIRRIILSEIPTVALSFDPLTDENPDINIIINNSALHNEFLGHRLSLIPMCFNAQEIKNYDPANYKMHLKVKNTGTSIIPVTTKDISIFNADGKKYPSAFHERIFPADSITKDHILITKLRPNIYNPEKGEEIDIEFFGSVGIAKTHARWSPVSCCAFENVIDEVEAAKVLKEKLSQFEKESEKEAYKRRFETLDKYRIFHMNSRGEANRFLFKIESKCGMSSREIYDQAYEVLKAKLIKFRDGSVRPVRIHNEKPFYEIIIEDEDYTLLNVLQSLIYNSENGKTIDYIGYNQPHPLDDKMSLKLRMIDENTDVWEFMKGCVDKIIASL